MSVSGTTWIKICGVTRVEDIEFCVELGVDAVGFNFVSGSPRCITPEHAAKIATTLPNEIERVGVFVNRTRSEVRQISIRAELSTLQFHGEEPDSMLSDWGEFKVIRAIRPKSEKEVLPLIQRTSTSRILIDAFCQDKHGGTGKQVSRELLDSAKLHCQSSLIISGGLTPKNVSDVVSVYRPYGVDVASGVEQSPGVKDRGLLEEFVAAVRASS